jgi:alpha-galactosidase/6-phospho-beta-glucosidase family protein
MSSTEDRIQAAKKLSDIQARARQALEAMIDQSTDDAIEFVLTGKLTESRREVSEAIDALLDASLDLHKAVARLSEDGIEPPTTN